ncbi:MAG: T9SS type A sorting domain-containing protein [Bacteroidetes bacterium]|nr:T9SS type A sorting domain-containing protein [Bacteroidota bacterium]
MKRFSLFFFLLICSLFLSGIVSGQTTVKGSPVADTGMITFQVDMTQWTARGLFHPATDSLDMTGTMNNWTGSPLLQKVDTTLVYQIVLRFNVATIQEFRFRINRDTNNAEINSHMYRIPNDTITIKYMYNDYDTGTVPITFKCNMYYQIRAHHFNPLPQHDYLDVAGTFDGNGAYDLLYDRSVHDSVGHDSIYQLTLNLPKSLISPVTPLAFKFRINGNWNTSEFMTTVGYRTFFLHDTTGGNMNLVNVWYDDRDPSIPAPPFVYNVYIQGDYYAKQILTGAYSYEDYNLRPEGNSLYRWYIADSITQVSLVPIGDSTINYVIDSLNTGKYIAFEVTPVASGTGDSLTGMPVMVWTGKIGGVGIHNLELNRVRLFPNPATSELTFENLGNTEQIEIYSIFGQKVSTIKTRNMNRISLDVSSLSSGIYLVKFYRTDNSFTSSKFIR